MEFVIITTTTETIFDAEKISKTLVSEKLAACVQIVGPIISTYTWKENIERTQEFILLIKTKDNLKVSVEKRIKEIHPYELPEFVVIPILDGSHEYLNWLRINTK